MLDSPPPFLDAPPRLPDDAAPPAAQRPAPARRRPGILLIDDDPFMLGVLSLMLRGLGYPTIGTADSAAAALDVLDKDPEGVDVVVCDLNMPGMDGIEFLQRLDASAFRGNVILLSGEGAHIMHTVQKLLSGGQLVILGALGKPVKRAMLQALLERWIPATVQDPPIVLPSFAAADLHEANRLRQWVLRYQPKVDLRTGVLVGTEALVRWAHPEHGLVDPGRFIALAEGCGAIDELTAWVLQEAFEQLGRWRDRGLPLHMAINVSMENLRAPGFARRVIDLARVARCSPRDVTLEVTESRLMDPSMLPLESLARLRMQRFGLSIDDFGTGHSSLVQLRDVPFTELKIDRGFVHAARHNQIIRPILEGSIGIAKRLGMQSVAEGVESEDDWQLLREIGCDLAQGWFIGRPMAPHDLPQWIEQWKSRCARLFAD
jgi:EAL domain-containing protein (putative c-di-GMP-specific phosphodiesterase class I)/CheY-like chemotaxis protein